MYILHKECDESSALASGSGAPPGVKATTDAHRFLFSCLFCLNNSYFCLFFFEIPTQPNPLTIHFLNKLLYKQHLCLNKMDG